MGEEFRKVLFDSFTQENRDDVPETRGTGPGLAIVNKLADRMGGTIRVQSAPGEGTAGARPYRPCRPTRFPMMCRNAWTPEWTGIFPSRSVQSRCPGKWQN